MLNSSSKGPNVPVEKKKLGAPPGERGERKDRAGNYHLFGGEGYARKKK